LAHTREIDRRTLRRGKIARYIVVRVRGTRMFLPVCLGVLPEVLSSAAGPLQSLQLRRARLGF
jgi:hypothetical protein